MEGMIFEIIMSFALNKSIYYLANIEENLQDQFVQEALTQVNSLHENCVSKN